MQDEGETDRLAAGIESLIEESFGSLSLDAQIAAVVRVMQRLLHHRDETT